MSSAYIELHACSAFSFLRGGSLPEQLATQAVQLGLPALAVCDRMGLYGAPRFCGAAAEAGLRPIYGAELAMEDGSVLPVLVQSRTGYQNLCQLLSQSHLRAPKGEGVVRWDELPEFADGLIALTGDDDGPLITALKSEWRTRPFESNPPREPRARSDSGAARSSPSPTSVLARLLQIFGRAQVFVEIQRHWRRGEDRWQRSLLDLAEAHEVPLLATNGVEHATPEGRQVVDAFTCLRHHTTLDDAGALLAVNSERCLKSAAQMKALFADRPEALANTVRLAERLEFRLADLGYEFPKFPVGPGETMESVLRDWAYRGARDRYQGQVPEKIRKLIEKELVLINKLGFAGYFLVVADLARYCREHRIMAQGRGSAANSAVCYCLGVTNVDPVRFNVLFERFLTENRKGWPDIDIDLPSGERREQVIQEVYRRYGPHGAAMTGTIITYRGRSATREIGKILGLPGDVLDRFSNLGRGRGDPSDPDDPLTRLERAGLSRTHPRAAAFASLYAQIRNLPRHLGQHTGGMIVCQGKLNRFIPLENAAMPGRVVAQWDKDDCEEMGIIKVDLLGLGMMAVLQDTVTLTAARGRPVDLAQLPENDPLTFDLLQRADTIGVFQVESRAQMATLPRMKPKTFYDLVIEVAIIRPGPIAGDLAHPYLRRRNGEEPVTYYAPQLKPVLERTLGVPLFQEQMLQLAMIMAQFSGDEAEELRRAMSFQRSDEKMIRAQERLRRALDRAGVSATVAEQIVKAVGSFALYGFPESHAISFAHLAYASAYLKVHRAPEFFCAMLNNQPMGFYSPATLVKDAKRHGVAIRAVCAVRSAWETRIEPDGALRLGFHQVQGLRREPALALLDERARKAFDSLDDFKARTRLTKDELRALAEIGALNGFAPHRRAALWTVEKTRRDGDLFAPGGFSLNEDAASARAPTGPSAGSPAQPLRPMDPLERLQADYAGLRLTTGPHPMALIRGRLPEVWRATDLKSARNGERVRVAGQVICRQRPGTAKGVCFVSLEDETGISNVIVAPGLFESDRLKIIMEPFLQIEGEVQTRHGTIHVKAGQIERLDYQSLRTDASHDFG